jgi:NAD(P)-dependent dehydrogenase (short-subunit alcohol dehydrogenase family)
MTDDIFGLTGKVAIVWGGGAGMGAATAHRLAALGAKIAVVDACESDATLTAASINGSGGSAIAIRADVTKECEIVAAVKQVCEELGSPQVSASVVGVSAWQPLIEMTLDQWEQQLRLNLTPMFLIGREVARQLSADDLPGAMAFVASVSGLQGAASHAAYGTAKGAMTALVRSMAVEWSPIGIRVNCLAPGPVATARIVPSEGMNALLRSRLPLGRFGEIDEMANSLVFLLSDMASYITGETLVADGGWMAAPLINPAENTRLPVARA